eukprot:CAMPEP_0178941574 /NCGR_PEP_ID=MMETSP0789-20121207/1484_1 /TAXON_ID=3005 /ORGANISM="Rhizosolenia setigera, Strain CCMP 1694" /LENGTH=393 /DNA_ID=CAMNT_0020620827 /DNA_START=1679 /DNA_END=2860 /DNA_ORIENTATION=-
MTDVDKSTGMNMTRHSPEARRVWPHNFSSQIQTPNNINMNKKTLSTILSMLFYTANQQTDAFVPTKFTNPVSSSIIRGIPPTKLYFRTDDEMIQSISSTPLLHEAESLISGDPNLVESVLLQDLSHVGMDLSVFIFGKDSTTALRFANLIGRILGIFSDYAIDHSIRPDELVFQVAMLGMSSVLLWSDIAPKLRTLNYGGSKQPFKKRDVVAYRKIFEPVGLSWQQYKTLLANDALQWVDSEHFYNVSESRSQLHWRYESKNMSCNTGSHACAQLLIQLEDMRHGVPSSSSSAKKSVHSDETATDAASSFLDASYGSARGNGDVLRFNVDQLFKVMESSRGLSESIILLVIDTIQRQQNNSTSDVASQKPSVAAGVDKSVFMTMSAQNASQRF